MDKYSVKDIAVLFEADGLRRIDIHLDVFGVGAALPAILQGDHARAVDCQPGVGSPASSVWRNMRMPLRCRVRFMGIGARRKDDVGGERHVAGGFFSKEMKAIDVKPGIARRGEKGVGAVCGVKLAGTGQRGGPYVGLFGEQPQAARVLQRVSLRECCGRERDPGPHPAPCLRLHPRPPCPCLYANDHDTQPAFTVNRCCLLRARRWR